MKNRKNYNRRKETWIAVILITAVFVLMWSIRPWKDDVVREPAAVEVPKVRRSIDGVLVEPGKENPPLAGVMVENMIEAQPLSGIADAALVFEAVAEANITRFLAYFVLDEQGVQEIGPVRSARPYYLDFAAEFNTLYGHVGSSPAAYELLRKKGVAGLQDLDQWYNEQYFFSKAGRPRPHHLYTSTELLGEAYSNFVISTKRAEGARGEISYDTSEQGVRSLDSARDDVPGWRFKSDASPDLRGNVTEIVVGYTPPYDVSWVYDKFENRYRRRQWGGIHKDADGKEIIARNIAVAFMEMKVLDELGRKEFTTTGEGKGLVFQDGRVVVGTWKKPGVKADALTPGKPDARERLRFYDGQGVEVEFNAGTIWVEVVPVGYAVKY